MKIPDSGEAAKNRPIANGGSQAINGSADVVGRESGEGGMEPEGNPEGDYVKLFLDENMVET